jgi:HlyD family secretion protein
VRRGEVVARLRPAPPALLDARSLAEARAAAEAAQDAVGRARAERDRARAADDRAHSDLERSLRLFEQGIVAKDEWEARQTDARAAGEALRAAEFAVGVAEDEEQRARSRLLQGSPSARGRVVEVGSPVDGVVLRRVRESEAVVPVGDALIEVGDPLKLEIVSDLLSTDAVRTRPGQEVLIEQWGGDKPLLARVRRVEPSGFLKISALGVEEQRVNIVVDFEEPSEAWKARGDAYRVELRVVIWEAQDAIKVASSSLFRRGDGWAAFVVEGGRARLRGVEAGHSNGLETEVLSGLSPGQAVVVHPSDRVADGIRVAPREP